MERRDTPIGGARWGGWARLVTAASVCAAALREQFDTVALFRRLFADAPNSQRRVRFSRNFEPSGPRVELDSTRSAFL